MGQATLCTVPLIIAPVDDMQDLRHQACGLDGFERGLTERPVGVVESHDDAEVIWVTRNQPQMGIDPADGRTGAFRTDSGAFLPRN
jgi:hypothetical protein